VVNSGQANAATGARGDADAALVTDAAAEALGLDASEMLACSTGVIGEPLHVDTYLAALPSVAAALRDDGGAAFARAIMTTDTVDKQAKADAGNHRVGGCVKGVGMIAPKLATMLAFVTLDAAVAPDDLQRLLVERLTPRFNAITVDACTSTNDSVMLFASGVKDAVAPGQAAWTELEAAVDAVGEELVRQQLADAEGVTHVLMIDVHGAASEDDARLVAMAVADSPLVKTAAFGGDPNPGRILQAVGSSGAAVEQGAVSIAIGGVELVREGVISPAYFEGPALHDAAASRMADPQIEIDVRLGQGAGRSRAFGCDLSYEYVRINGEYTT
jgi:glutamate N-acetyltransferase/amino-acid N-acetyltransferase